MQETLAPTFVLVVSGCIDRIWTDVGEDAIT